VGDREKCLCGTAREFVRVHVKGLRVGGCMCVGRRVYWYIRVYHVTGMGWLRSVGSIKL